MRLASEEFVPVAADDWYLRRQDDAEGRFLRQVADQGPRKGERDSTRQGIYALTADGKLLGYKNAGQNVEVMREVLRDGLAAWKKLPETRRKPGAVTVDAPGQADDRFARKPPEGGAIIDVYTRALERDSDGSFADADCALGGGDEAARDHLWLTGEEVRAMVPDGAKPGQTFPLPAKVAERIARFHLVDDTRGEPPFWSREQVRSNEMTLTVERVTPERVELRLDGSALLSTAADPAKAERGYDVRLVGEVAFDRKARAFTRFNAVALGDHWGDGPYTKGARPGRSPLGIAFELAGGDKPIDLIPPQAAREVGAYFGRY